MPPGYVDRDDGRTVDAPEPRQDGSRVIPFEAEVDATELDDRERPGPTWTAKTRAISRSQLVLRSRRMCYVGRRVAVAVHLVDDRPMPLLGKVVECDYDGEGLYRIVLDLLPMSDRQELREWLARR